MDRNNIFGRTLEAWQHMGAREAAIYRDGILGLDGREWDCDYYRFDRDLFEDNLRTLLENPAVNNAEELWKALERGIHDEIDMECNMSRRM